MFPSTRMRRYRSSTGMRRMLEETFLRSDDLILPLFLVPGPGRREEIASMPGVFRISVDLLASKAEGLRVPAVLLFGVPDAEHKDERGTGAVLDEGLVPTAARLMKSVRPDLTVITDVCLCAYTSHGHCGILTGRGEVDNDSTLELLSRMAQAHASAGADVVAPSAMMDGQVRAIRDGLDGAGFEGVSIMSYAAKFASSFYGPFREAAHSAPQFGDRRSYQIPPANRREAVRDALLDEKEGADWLMVKPAMPYLDVLLELRNRTELPIAAYQVSGEYTMLKLAGRSGVLSERATVCEALLAIKRAGADAVITYYAEEVCAWLTEK